MSIGLRGYAETQHMRTVVAIVLWKLGDQPVQSTLLLAPVNIRSRNQHHPVLPQGDAYLPLRSLRPCLEILPSQSQDVGVWQLAMS